MITLESERLRLRECTADDAADAFRLYSDPLVSTYLPAPPPDVENMRERIVRHIENAWRAHGHGLMSVFLKSDGRFIGMCGLLHWDLDGTEETEVAYSLLPDAWGHGYALEAARALADDAFTRLGRTRVVSLIHPENSASVKVALKNGMLLERATELFGKPVNVYARSAQV